VNCFLGQEKGLVWKGLSTQIRGKKQHSADLDLYASFAFMIGDAVTALHRQRRCTSAKPVTSKRAT